MHTLMYGGGISPVPKTNVVVEVQGWFCNGVSGDGDCGDMNSFSPDNGLQQVTTYYSHALVQYTTWDSAVTDARSVDIWDRGGDTVASDWDGAPQDCPPAVSSNDPTYYINSYDLACSQKYIDQDSGYQKMVTSIHQTLPTYRPGANMKFFMIMDDAAWKFLCAPNSNYHYSGQNEPWCAANKMVKDLDYLSSTYTSSSNYAEYNGLPLIGFFQNEGSNGVGGDMDYCQNNACVYDDAQDQCIGEANCYAAIYQQVRAEATSLFGANGFYMIFAYKSGCPIYSPNGNTGHPDSDGCYAWPQPYVAMQPGNITNQTQQYTYTAGVGPALDGFYYTTVHTICSANGGILAGCKGDNGQQLLLMGAAFKGFDDLMTNPNAPGWYAARVATQGCGTTWTNTWKEMNSWYNPTSNPLPYMMVDTWDDYEEGTEIETGMDNCIKASTFSLSVNSGTSQLTWSYQFDSTRDPEHQANPVTVDHYDLYSIPGSCTNDCSYTLLDHNITPTEAGCTMQPYPIVNCSIGVTLSKYDLPAGRYGVFVEAVGKSGVTNWLAPTGASYTAP